MRRTCGRQVPRLTAVEIDDRLARSLAGRLGGTNVTVLHADATALPFCTPATTTCRSTRPRWGAGWPPRGFADATVEVQGDRFRFLAAVPA